MSTIENLRNRRSHLKGTATRLEKFLERVNNETSLFDLRSRLENLEKLFESFQSLDIEMAAHADNIPDRETELEEFENRYYSMKTKYCEIIEARLHAPNIVDDHLNSTTIQQDVIQKLLETQATFIEKLSAIQASTTNNPSNITQSTSSSIHAADVRLPKLNIPVFDGNYSEFRSFFDLFKSSVDNNHSLTASQKFQYLKGFLKGEPAMLIKHLVVSDSNYAEALLKIKERYDKPSMVIDSLIETFLSIPKGNNPRSLRNVSNIADEVIRGLRAQGTEAEKRDPWLIHILLNKIDRESHKAWAEYCSKTTFPSLESFLKFINDRCDALERVPALEDRNRPSSSQTKGKSLRSYASVMKKPCAACAQNHHLSYCPTFNRMAVQNRGEFVKEKRLCFNCLKSGHGVQNCPSKHVCEICNLHHHTSIHTDRKPKSSMDDTSKNITVSFPREIKSTIDVTSKPETTAGVSLAEASNTLSDISINLSASLDLKAINMLLPTAKVLVKDILGYYQSCNVLLDSGCQIH